MDIGLMLKQSWQVVWQHKFLWVLGFFAGLTAVCFDFLRLFFGTRALGQFQELLRWAQAPQPAPFPIDFNFTDAELARIFIGFVIVFLVVFLGFWVVATVAEAGIIQTAVNLERGEAVGLGTAVRSGFHWLGRFVAIDALVFFPWFLLALCTILLMIVLLLLVGYLGLNQAELSSLFAVVGIGLLCVIPLFLLLIPVAWLSFIYRTIAFRDAVLLDHAVRVSVRHTWQVVRRHLSTAVLVTLLMVAGQSNECIDWS